MIQKKFEKGTEDHIKLQEIINSLDKENAGLLKTRADNMKHIQDGLAEKGVIFDNQGLKRTHGCDKFAPLSIQSFLVRYVTGLICRGKWGENCISPWMTQYFWAGKR